MVCLFKRLRREPVPRSAVGMVRFAELLGRGVAILINAVMLFVREEGEDRVAGEPQANGEQQRDQRALVVVRDVDRFFEHIGRAFGEPVQSTGLERFAAKIGFELRNIGFDQRLGRVAQRTIQPQLSGKQILADSGLPIVSADNLGDAAAKIVKAVKEAA